MALPTSGLVQTTDKGTEGESTDGIKIGEGMKWLQTVTEVYPVVAVD